MSSDVTASNLQCSSRSQGSKRQRISEEDRPREKLAPIVCRKLDVDLSNLAVWTCAVWPCGRVYILPGFRARRQVHLRAQTARRQPECVPSAESGKRRDLQEDRVGLGWGPGASGGVLEGGKELQSVMPVRW